MNTKVASVSIITMFTRVSMAAVVTKFASVCTYHGYKSSYDCCGYQS
jgi:hypothetical protein